jgi:hypothetical protein
MIIKEKNQEEKDECLIHYVYEHNMISIEMPLGDLLLPVRLLERKYRQ